MYTKAKLQPKTFQYSEYAGFNFYTLKAAGILTGIPVHQLRRATSPDNNPPFVIMDTRGLEGFPKSKRYFMENDLVKYLRQFLLNNQQDDILEDWSDKNFEFDKVNPEWVTQLKRRKLKVKSNSSKHGQSVYLRYSAQEALVELQELLKVDTPSDAVELVTNMVKSGETARRLNNQLVQLKQQLDKHI